jgi:hypothetical protein
LSDVSIRPRISFLRRWQDFEILQIARDGLKLGIVASSMTITVTRKDTMSPMMTSCNVDSIWRKAEKDQKILETTSEMAFQENVHSWASFSNEAQTSKIVER